MSNKNILNVYFGLIPMYHIDLSGVSLNLNHEKSVEKIAGEIKKHFHERYDSNSWPDINLGYGRLVEEIGDAKKLIDYCSVFGGIDFIEPLDFTSNDNFRFNHKIIFKVIYQKKN